MREKIPKNLGHYEHILNAAASVKQNIVLKNGNTNKSEFAVAKIMEIAEKEIFMFSSDLSKNGFRSEMYIKNFISFLKKDTSNKINIILEKDEGSSESLNMFKILREKEEFRNQISLSILNTGTEIKKTPNGKKFHFLINPSKGIYRFEYNIEERKAFINFNDKQYSNNLKIVFDEYKENSREISFDFSEELLKSSLKEELDNSFLVA